MGDLLAGSDSDGEVKFTINESYASKYGTWREKEVMQKLKDRLGDRADNEELSTSEDDEDAKDLQQVEKGFFRTLSYLKRKDPCIYNENTKFYPSPQFSSEDGGETTNKQARGKEDKPFLLRDYERKIVLEKDGMLSDDEDENAEKDVRAFSPTYIEEQKAIKESFKQALENSDTEDEGVDKLLKKRTKSEAEIKKEDDDYKEWLKGQKDKLRDKDTESDLKELHDYWNDPSLNADETYLRDYILNKRFLEKDDDDFDPEYNEVIHDDDDLENDMQDIEQQEQFEQKYNFRFEEPDQEFIKRYPRSMENSLRRKDDRRKIKRQEIRERKEAEMAAKREEIKQLKALKRKEILAKIEKIKEVTGNQEIGFQDDDLEEEFSPEKHDQKMKELFNDEYYQVEETEKPKYPELDNELEIENWENWKGKDQEQEYNDHSQNGSWERPDCEDPNFIMDCDYDPKVQLQEELIKVSKSKKKQRRKSRFAEAVAKEKPVFDPSNSKFEEYLDEYYKLDCEDIIGDLPCRFKYRNTTRNDYGLTVDEILRADVKELNKWCSLKKVVKYKPENVESYEVHAYKQKAKNEALKRKILPSLYVSAPADDYQNNEDDTTETGKEKKKKRKKKGHAAAEQNLSTELESAPDNSRQDEDGATETGKEKKRKKKKESHTAAEQKLNTELESSTYTGCENEEKRLEENESVKKKKNKHKRKRYEENGDTEHLDSSVKKRKLEGENSSVVNSTEEKIEKKGKGVNEVIDSGSSENSVQKSRKNKMQNTMPQHSEKSRNKNFKKWDKSGQKSNHKRKGYRDTQAKDEFPVSDARLKAYGIHPKKFKNKLKYGNKSNSWNDAKS